MYILVLRTQIFSCTIEVSPWIPWKLVINTINKDRIENNGKKYNILLLHIWEISGRIFWFPHAKNMFVHLFLFYFILDPLRGAFVLISALFSPSKVCIWLCIIYILFSVIIWYKKPAMEKKSVNGIQMHK